MRSSVRSTIVAADLVTNTENPSQHVSCPLLRPCLPRLGSPILNRLSHYSKLFLKNIRECPRSSWALHDAGFTVSTGLLGLHPDAHVWIGSSDEDCKRYGTPGTNTLEEVMILTRSRCSSDRRTSQKDDAGRWERISTETRTHWQYLFGNVHKTAHGLIFLLIWGGIQELRRECTDSSVSWHQTYSSYIRRIYS